MKNSTQFPIFIFEGRHVIHAYLDTDGYYMQYDILPANSEKLRKYPTLLGMTITKSITSMVYFLLMQKHKQYQERMREWLEEQLEER